MQRLLLGTTFSHRHLRHFRIDAQGALKELFTLRFDIVRLGCYWDDLEPEKGKYDFSEMEALLSACEKAGQQVVLTVGMKAPRWPEYYFPKWLSDKTPEGAREYVLEFVRIVIGRFKRFSNITHWQVENEPLDPSGAKKLAIPLSLLADEVDTVRRLDKRPVHLTLLAKGLTRRSTVDAVFNLADIPGFDVYYKAPLFSRFYIGPLGSERRIATRISAGNKPFWITELQAEPWEQQSAVAFSDNPPSMNPRLLIENFEKAKMLRPQAILLWGFEFWLYKKLHKDPRMWDLVSKLIQDVKSTSTLS